MWNQYVDEKLRQFEAERCRPMPVEQLAAVTERQERPRRVLGPLARVTGRGVRRLGEALESWAVVGSQ